MTLSRLPLLLLPIAVLSVLGLTAVQAPRVEPGLQVAKSGVVVDAQTQQPLAGVYVVARWLEQTTESSASSDGKTHGQCVFRTVVRTDEQGRYEIPASRFPIGADKSMAEHQYYWDMYAYAPGFSAQSLRGHPRVQGAAVPGLQVIAPIRLAVDHAPPQQRVALLAETLAHFTCETFSRESIPVARQIYAEAYAAACLPEPNEAAGLLARLHDQKHEDRAGAPGTPCAQWRQASNTTP
jgi:hypothetical protein